MRKVAAILYLAPSHQTEGVVVRLIMEVTAVQEVPAVVEVAIQAGQPKLVAQVIPHQQVHHKEVLAVTVDLVIHLILPEVVVVLAQLEETPHLQMQVVVAVEPYHLFQELLLPTQVAVVEVQTQALPQEQAEQAAEAME